MYFHFSISISLLTLGVTLLELEDPLSTGFGGRATSLSAEASIRWVWGLLISTLILIALELCSRPLLVEC